MKCLVCEETGWVCENNPQRPWDGPRAWPCGGAGMPCRGCNPIDEGTLLRLPSGFTDDGDATRH
jgi:hypothetical protein